MEPVSWIGLGLGASALGLQVFNTLEAGEQAAAQAREEAALRRLQAKEILDRSKLNERIAELEGEDLLANVTAALARTGGGTVSGWSLYQRAAERVRLEIVNQRRESEFRARMILLGADYSEAAGESARKASVFDAITGGIGGFGTLLTASGALNRGSRNPYSAKPYTESNFGLPPIDTFGSP